MTVWEKKRKVMNRYNFFCDVYDQSYSKEQELKIKSALNLADLNDNPIVLDIGCGTGNVFSFISDRANILVGVDFSIKMIKMAKKRSKKFSKVNLILADSDFMPFPQGTFNEIYAISLLQNMPDPKSTLLEIERVSKRRSMIIVTGLKKKFNKDNFFHLLKKVGLKVLFSEPGKNLKLKDGNK